MGIVLVIYLAVLSSFKPYYSWIVYYGDLVITIGKVCLLVVAPLYTATGEGEALIYAIIFVSYGLMFGLLAYAAYFVFLLKVKEQATKLDDVLADVGGKVVEPLPTTGPLMNIVDAVGGKGKETTEEAQTNAGGMVSAVAGPSQQGPDVR